jgi:hypothetical protein
MDVFARVAAIAEHAGFFALTLTSLDDDATAFYKSLNFTVYSENLQNPKMLYPLEDILTLVQFKFSTCQCPFPLPRRWMLHPQSYQTLFAMITRRFSRKTVLLAWAARHGQPHDSRRKRQENDSANC